MVHFFCTDEHGDKMIAGTCTRVDVLQGDRPWAEFFEPRRCVVWYPRDLGLETARNIRDLYNFPVQTWDYAHLESFKTHLEAMERIYSKVCNALVNYWPAKPEQERERRKWLKVAFEGGEKAYNFLTSKDFKAFLVLLKWMKL